ncbi:MAG: hypothetical protein ACJAV5_000185 [Vicingaceae bacterium]|jgi:hypothetical protein
MFKSHIDQSKQEELNTLGYTVIGKMDENILQAAKKHTTDFLKAAKLKCPNRQLFNLINSKVEIKLESNRIVDQYLNTFLKQNFELNQVDLFPVSHIVKPFGLKSSIYHQDSSIVDERVNFSLNAWVPLVHSNKLNGCMWFLPGSHKTQNNFRQFGFNPFVGKLLKQVKPLLKPFPVKAGEVVVFHRNIIHGSSINYLPSNRVALESVIVNKNAQLYNFHREESISKTKVLGYKVDIHHFLRANPKEDFYAQRYDYDEFNDLGMDGITILLKGELKQLHQI